MAEQLKGEDLELTEAGPLSSLAFLVMLTGIQCKDEQVVLGQEEASRDLVWLVCLMLLLLIVHELVVAVPFSDEDWLLYQYLWRELIKL